MNEREALLKRVQVCDFALIDAALFLDTHPNDQDALAFYKKYNDMRKKAIEDFTAKFGPLKQTDFNGGSHWTWVDGPWPWQNEEV